MKRYLNNNLIRVTGFLIVYMAVFLYTIIFNNPTGWLFFFFLTFLLLYDVLSLFPSLKTIQIKLLENTAYEADRPNNIKLEIYRYRPTLFRIPILMLLFPTNLPVKKQYLSFYSGQNKELIFEWRPAKRGVFQHIPLILISSDLFQIFSKRSKVSLTGPFVVTPVLRLDSAEQIYQHLLHFSPSLTSPYGDQTFSIRNFRKYQRGDSFHSVDWKQSSKRNELIVKEYDRETETDTHFLFYGLAHEKFEEILSIYYSFINLVEIKLPFQQTILAEIPSITQKEHLFSTMMPLAEECLLPAFMNKKLVIFAPSKTTDLTEQLNRLQRTNDIFLVTFSGEKLCLDWINHEKIIEVGGYIFD